AFAATAAAHLTVSVSCLVGWLALEALAASRPIARSDTGAREGLDDCRAVLEYGGGNLATARPSGSVERRAPPRLIPPARRGLRGAARPACQSADTMRVGTGEGYEVLLFPPDEEGVATVRFVGRVRERPVGLRVGGVPVPFLRPINPNGYALVRGKELLPVWKGAELRVITADRPGPPQGEH